MKKKVKIAALVLVGVAAGATWLVLRRPHSDLAIVGEYKGPLRLISRETVQAAPLIDLPLLGGSRWRFPEPEPGASDYRRILKDRAFAGGLLMSLADQADENLPIGQGADRESIWKVDKQTFHGWTLMTEASTFLCAPYVFGSSSKIVKLRPIDGGTWLSIRLPANGIPEPKVTETTQQFGGLQVRVGAGRVISPAAPLVINLSVVNAKPTDLYVLKVGDRPFELVEGAAAMTFTLATWKTEMILPLSICRVTRRPAHLKVGRTDMGSISKVSLRSPKGVLLMTAEAGPNGRGSEPGPFLIGENYLDTNREDLVYFDREEDGWYCGLDHNVFENPRRFFQKLKNGQLVPAVLLHPGPMTEGELKLSLPDPALFHQE